MFYLVNHNYRFIFIITRKCASNTLIEIFRKISKSEPVKEEINLELLKKMQSQGYEVYQFVRNPYDRFISTYVNKFVNKTVFDKPGYNKFKLVTGIKNFQELTFQMFIDYIHNNRILLQDTHARPMSINFKPNHVIKIENLGHFLESFLKKHNILTPVQELSNLSFNSTEKTSKIIKGIYNFKAKNISEIPHYSSFYNEDIKNKVNILQ